MNSPNNNFLIHKSCARLAAVQAVYANFMSEENKSSSAITLDLISYYNDEIKDNESQDDKIVQPDARFLSRIIDKTLSEVETLDNIIVEFLAENWTLDKISAVILAILRCATCELKFMLDVPTKVVINEYTNLTRSFFTSKETSFVNGVLDKIASHVRAKV